MASARPDTRPVASFSSRQPGTRRKVRMSPTSFVLLLSQSRRPRKCRAAGSRFPSASFTERTPPRRPNPHQPARRSPSFHHTDTPFHARGGHDRWPDGMRLPPSTRARSDGGRADRAKGRGAAAEPRALVARLQRACARARGRRRPAAARARQVLLDLRVEPRRVLHGARRRPHGPGGAGLAVRSADGRTPQGARRDPRAGPRAQRRAVAALEPRARARARGGGNRGRRRSTTAPRRSSRSSTERFDREIYPVLTPLAVGPGSRSRTSRASRSASPCSSATRRPARSASRA